ncbi:MAG: hypothetical protein JWQ96_2881 [Segetibacter sp.]|nr:hypothetical protein [Segetibacter sp.]
MFFFLQDILLNRMIKDPKVENTKTITSFLNDNKFDTTNSLILKADTQNVELQLLKGLTTGYYIFDSLGKHICYKGLATCKGVQFKDLLNNKVDSFNYCKSDTIQLDKVLQQTYDLKEQNVSISEFSKSKYFIVAYWQNLWEEKEDMKMQYYGCRMRQKIIRISRS